MLTLMRSGWVKLQPMILKVKAAVWGIQRLRPSCAWCQHLGFTKTNLIGGTHASSKMATSNSAILSALNYLLFLTR